MNLQERKLRKLIRKGIQIVLERKEQQKIEEQRLRKIIQHLIQEVKGNTSVADKVIHNNTGINELDSVLKRVITQIEDAYTNLSTNETQRKSFRYHFLVNFKNALQTVNANRFAPVNEQKIDVTVDDKFEDDDIISAADPDKFIPSRPKDIAAAKEEKKEEEESTFIKLDSDDPNVSQGAAKSEDAWNEVETQFVTAYEQLIVPEDAEAFFDYGLTNLKLYFDKFEGEMKTSGDEPESPDYPPS